jgi:hypothetical protein
MKVVMDALLNFLFENWPYAIWIVVGGALVYFYFVIKNGVDSAHSKISTLPCDTHKGTLNKYEESLGKYNEKINTIDVLNAKFDVMMQTLQTLAVGKRNPIIQSFSPISLTEYGKKLTEELSMGDYISDNWESISKYIKDNSESMNPYDIQQLCSNYVLMEPDKVLSREGHDRVKSKAFVLGIAVFDLLRAASILIRDRFFKENNIDVSDIDQYDPQTSIKI